MQEKEKHLHKVYQVGDHSFPVYREYDEQLDKSYPAFPDFEKCPEYTAEGRPFVTAVQDSCPYAMARDPEEETPGDCSDCRWFFREHIPYDPIGICMNEKWKKSLNKKVKHSDIEKK